MKKATENWRRGRLVGLVAVFLLVAAELHASGPLGIYGIVERIVFEPGGETPGRVQVWGVFAFADGPGAEPGVAMSEPARGYFYFTLPAGASPQEIETIRAEWNDLATMAGTGQAVAFGAYNYIGGFGGLRTDEATSSPPYILDPPSPSGNAVTRTLRVRAASEPVADPAVYNTNVGVVRLDAAGSHRDVVAALRDRLD